METGSSREGEDGMVRWEKFAEKYEDTREDISNK